jgi:hypothetical protein
MRRLPSPHKPRPRVRKYLPTPFVFVLSIGLFVVALATPDVSGQEASSFQELQRLVQVGDEVRVTEVSGVATEGKLTTLSDSALRLSGFRRDVSSRQILLVERIKKDPLVDGVAAGSLVGAASGAALLVLVCNSRYSPCRNHSGGVAATLGISAAIGAGIGALIDAGAVKSEIVYRASKQTTRLYVAPYLAGRSKGVQISVRF